MDKKVLKLSLSTLLSLLSFFIFTTTTSAQEMPQPNKTEFIEIDNQKVPVFHFDDPAEADLHRIKWAEATQELIDLKNTGGLKTFEDNEIDSEISPLALTSYVYKGFNGTAPFKYKFNVYENRTNSTLEIERKVSNKASSSTTTDVGITFKNVFKSNVGKTFAKDTSYSETYKLKIPKKKQGEIWTWNFAEKYSFQKKSGSKSTSFTAWRPTASYGSAVYYLDFRDPS